MPRRSQLSRLPARDEGWRARALDCTRTALLRPPTHRGGGGLGHHSHAAGRHARRGLGGKALRQAGQRAGSSSGPEQVAKGPRRRDRGPAAEAPAGIGGRGCRALSRRLVTYSVVAPWWAPRPQGGRTATLRLGLRLTLADTRWVGAATKAVVICTGRGGAGRLSGGPGLMRALAGPPPQRPNCCSQWRPCLLVMRQERSVHKRRLGGGPTLIYLWLAWPGRTLRSLPSPAALMGPRQGQQSPWRGPPGSRRPRACRRLGVARQDLPGLPTF